MKRWCTRKTGIRPEGVSNHLARDFAAVRPSTKWVRDIMYIHTAEGWLYKSRVGSGHWVGKATSAAVVFHSERGIQYTSREFQTFLHTHGMVRSMSSVGNCYDNAMAESLFGLVKRERVHLRRYRTRAKARTNIFDYIERFYNRQPRHSYSQRLPPGIYATTRIIDS